MMYLHEAKRARVQLRIGEKEVFFLWSEKELRKLKRKANNLQNPRQPIQNNVAGNAANPQNSESEDNEDIDDIESDPDPFMFDGSWNPIHLRRILHVMDMFKISYRGYHELRMISRSILPPLTRLKKAKAKMSDEIKCYHHHEVRGFNNFT